MGTQVTSEAIMDNGHGRAGRARILTAVLAAETERDAEAMSSRARRALANLGRATDAFAEAERAYTPDDRGAYNRAALTVHLLNLALIECEEAGIDAEALRPRLVDVQRVYARSSFVRRLQTWPRGYPGDWETLDYLLDGVNRTPETEFAHHLERYALWCAAAQQHRNKVAYQASLCARVMSANPAAKILSIACGGSRDLATLVDRAHAFSGAIVLNDADPSALELSRQRLRAFSSCCTTVAGRVLDLRARLVMLGPYDLVMAGGLFDYLSDALVVRLLRTAHRDYLAPGGVLYFTNIAAGNPYRLWMGLVGDWRLIERTEADIRHLCTRAGIADADVDLARDTTGLAWLVQIRKGTEITI
jgi:extracellular factor (EF) 3-hydroxypalmitic acid methyl ester biosynthesis protein